MSRTLTHRGPDEAGVYYDNFASLAVRRLAIIDLVTGQQPYRNETGDIHAVFNGEIYGFLSLRTDLERRGHKFVGQADGEVIIHAYEEFGERFVSRLDGMFAFAVWDRRKRKLLLGRDRVGKKPLYIVRHGNGTITFASELQALLQDPQVDPVIDDEAIAQYLAHGYVPWPDTGFVGVEKLPPATLVVSDEHGIRQYRYWSLDYEPKLEIRPEATLADFDTRLAQCVRERMVSDVPLGAWLSGGVDSSLVVAHMVEQASNPIHTFTIGFDEPQYDERPYAAAVAAHFGTDHHDELVSADDLLSVLPLLVRHYGEPYADSSAVPTYFLARMTSQHVTVAITGDGGDELLGGYRRHTAAILAEAIDLLPEKVRVGLRNLAATATSGSADSQSWRHRAYRFARALDLPPDVRFNAWGGLLGDPDIARLVDHVPQAGPLVSPSLAIRPLDRVLALDVIHYLPDDLLAKTDITTMACSLEARAPLLDFRLLEWAASLPTSVKHRRMKRKWLAREALSRRTPRTLTERPKMGFAAPIPTWLRTQLRDLVIDTLLHPTAATRRYFRSTMMEQYVGEHMSGSADHGRALWAALMLELWHNEMVRMPLRSSAASEVHRNHH